MISTKKLLLLAICCIHTTFHGMKRSTENPLSTPRPAKRKKTERNKPLHLHNIFNIHTQLQHNIQKTYKHQSPEQQKALLLIKQLPHDIKQLIAVNLIHNNNPWWYFNTTISHSQKTICSLSFHPHDKSLAVGTDKLINIINPKTAELIKSHNSQGFVYSLTHSHSGDSLAYGLCNGNVEVRSSDLEKSLFFYNAEMPIWSIALSQDGKTIAMGSDQMTEYHNLLLMNLESNESIASIPHNERNIYGMYFNTHNTLKYTLSPNRLATYHTKNHTRYSTKFPLNKYIWSLSVDKNNRCAVGMNCQKAYILNASSHKKLASFRTLSHIYSVALRNNMLAVGLQNGNIVFFKEHTKPTPQQQLLREILFLWTQLEKPDKAIRSPQALLDTICQKLNLNTEEVGSAWNSLPSAAADCLWHTMNRIIQKYGKNIKQKK